SSDVCSSDLPAPPSCAGTRRWSRGPATCRASRAVAAGPAAAVPRRWRRCRARPPRRWPRWSGTASSVTPAPRVTTRTGRTLSGDHYRGLPGHLTGGLTRPDRAKGPVNTLVPGSAVSAAGVLDPGDRLPPLREPDALLSL